jgi:hypothetical protein
MKYTETNLKSLSNYNEFGKFIINMKMLNQNYLSVKYKSNAPVPSIKKIKISDEFVDSLIYIFDTGKIDYEKLRELTNVENNLFKNLIMKSGLFNILKYNYNNTRENIDDIIDDYEVLKGELEAGNNNPDILDKCRIVIKKLFIYGKISENEYNDLTNDL